MVKPSMVYTVGRIYGKGGWGTAVWFESGVKTVGVMASDSGDDGRDERRLS